MIWAVHMILIQKLGHAEILQQNLVVLARMYFFLFHDDACSKAEFSYW